MSCLSSPQNLHRLSRAWQGTCTAILCGKLWFLCACCSGAATLTLHAGALLITLCFMPTLIMSNCRFCTPSVRSCRANTSLHCSTYRLQETCPLVHTAVGTVHDCRAEEHKPAPVYTNSEEQLVVRMRPVTSEPADSVAAPLLGV